MREGYMNKNMARVVADAVEAAVIQLNDERFFESEAQRRLFWRFSALIRRHVERELHVGIEESRVFDKESKMFDVGGD